ncbi:MAG TPA: glycoside hydrolase [Verrucomicrobiae bacterium]|nr:glycoside hydrolase [Verrucomicrobiae bacterium]
MKQILLFLLIASSLCPGGRAEPLVIENTAIRVELAPETGCIRVVEKGNGSAWEQPPAKPSASPVYQKLAHKDSMLEVERTFDAGKGTRLPLKIRLSLPDAASPELRVEATAADPKATMGDLRFLEPFMLDAPRGVLAVADYGNGHLYPLDTKPFPRKSFGGDRLDLPWVGLCDLDTGRACLLLLETSDDSSITMQEFPGANGRTIVAPQVTWRPQKGSWGYARAVRYHFEPRGGYVALCKRYRKYAAEHGLLVPFTEKLKKTPNLPRLFGAPDVWGNASLAFAREAKAAGVEKMLIHGRPATPADMRSINELGYLTSEYDNYTDILPTEDGKISSNRAILPDQAVLKSDGQRMTAWLTWDKKTQYMKRCPMLWVDAAKNTADKVLAEWPFIGRFIDVTTAESMYECFDEKHPMTKTQKRECGPALHRVFRDRGLVMGGEHGIWWCPQVVDYIEGMMSGGNASWPAGHLIHPKTKDQEFEGAGRKLTTKWADYERWGIGHEWRAPLWELVFHDCIVSTWYWGDASDWLLDAAPEITPKKDAYNILYGTIPLLWANAGGSWMKDRAVFLRTYRNTCKLHEAIATAELLSHEFVTPDHAVQRTRFADGTECIVNFGAKPHRATVGDRDYLLPQNGWAVKGPAIEQSLSLQGDRQVTTIRARGYSFTDEGGAPVTLSSSGAGSMRALVGAPAPRVRLEPGKAARGWTPEGASLYRLDLEGSPADVIDFRPEGTDALEFGPVDAPGSFLLLWGDGANRPDLRAKALRLDPAAPRQGDALKLTATIENVGGASARDVPVEFLVDGQSVHRAEITIGLRGVATVAAEIDTGRADGDRQFAVVANPGQKVAEISAQNNRAEQSAHIAPDWSRWPHRRRLQIAAAGVLRQDEPVVVPFALPAGADTNSVRVAEQDKDGQPSKACPAQIDGGELCLIVPGTLPADATRKLIVLWRDASAEPRSMPPGGTFWNEDRGAIATPRYEVRFENGTIASVTTRSQVHPATPFMKSIILSSRETGWGEEEAAQVEQFTVKHAGPVRTVIQVRKALKAGVTYDKQYDFYPERFDVEIALNKSAGGLYSRAHYQATGTYVDDKGNTAQVDGTGAADGIYGKNRNPKWYAVFARDWAHSCIALSAFDHNAYWDAGSSWGAIGFTVGGNRTRDIRLSYVIHPGSNDARFAEDDYRKLTTPVAVSWP